MTGNLDMKPIQVGLLGIGTVGSGVFNVLQRNQEEIHRRAGRGIEIAMVADLDAERARSIVGDKARVVGDAREVIANPEIDIVVELIGGYGIAKQLVLEAVAAGKHVVTANKALLAVHGTEIFKAAAEKGVVVAYEAAVAGGIPIIKALREGLAANQIQWVAGIINGTTNFILSEMRDKGLDFDVVLKEAQRLGYAEADPTFDIEGVDAAHKATIMSAIAFGIPVQFDKAYVEGITKLAATDIRYAEQLGYRIKLLGITKRMDKGVELRVHPSLVPAKRLIANVEGAMNAVVVHGDAVGTTLYYGKGAGSEPTASAVIADLVDITRLIEADPTHRVPPLAFQSHTLREAWPGLARAAHGRGGHQLLPAHPRGGRGRRARQDYRHPGRRRHQHRRRAAARGRRGGRRGLHADRPDHPHARHARGRHGRGARADPGAAHGAGADHAHPQGRAELIWLQFWLDGPERSLP
ncbi:homoserine dehydrogenase [Alicycliphilus sp. B1]|nr:homoserine dehydrogenase [Alicycliphilus sp. B1]